MSKPTELRLLGHFFFTPSRKGIFLVFHTSHLQRDITGQLQGANHQRALNRKVGRFGLVR